MPSSRENRYLKVERLPDQTDHPDILQAIRACEKVEFKGRIEDRLQGHIDDLIDIRTFGSPIPLPIV
jgi:predicted HAD superfamily Cof-like phosphohydrolase